MEKLNIKQQSEEKKAYRTKIKAEQVVQQVVQQVAPTVAKQVAQESKSKITNFFKPAVKQVADGSQPKITGFFKPITKEQYFKNIKNEPIKTLIKDINTFYPLYLIRLF